VINEQVVDVDAGARVRLPERIVAGQHVVKRGSECRAGVVVARAGTRVTPLAVAALTTVGRVRVKVVPPPSVAVISTGDELVPADRRPDEVQIRDSNGPMLASMALRAGTAAPLSLHAEDNMESLAAALHRASEVDLVLLSGGVSAGRYDLVPAAIEAYGATPVFHKVTQKPGKPLLFAKKGGQLIFGMPGNPLSGHFCFVRYVEPVVRRMMGCHAEEPNREGRLATELEVSSERTLFLQARASFEGGKEASLTPLLAKGSADIFAALDANAYLRLPPGEHRLQSGDRVSYQLLEVRR
jgi:molybdopterin molybdotransferase